MEPKTEAQKLFIKELKSEGQTGCIIYIRQDEAQLHFEGSQANPKELESKSTPRKSIYEYKLPDGSFVSVGRLHDGFFEMLRELDAPTKIKMMQLSENDCQAYFMQARKSSEEFVKSILGRTWYWRDSGERIMKGETELPEFGFQTKSQLNRKIKTLPISDLDNIIRWFTDDSSELYYKED